ncbi:hypothetical protein CYLTODRAFT_495582 [Cylindrobasidium torrendii FP15055 ss-10]|uniref:Uncharacterized protein n=1 Tax=Cylindrobasidium torrendii FP15055 ss-10 TaxID=1314674 RepID=A0A0D7AQR8_9AGAR|nr:hypothetical protein CYLTODRAFT_495582 [Cylindrobasidium torrendii FP15055 ss-10]
MDSVRSMPTEAADTDSPASSTQPTGPATTQSDLPATTPSSPVSTAPERAVDKSVVPSNTGNEHPGDGGGDEHSPVTPAPASEPEPVRPKARPASRVKRPLIDVEGLDIDEEDLLERADEICITAPESLADVLAKMREKDAGVLGRKWDVFVADMVLLDSEEGFMKPLKALPVGTGASKRPKMLTDWQNAGRCRRLKDKGGRKSDAKEMPLLDAGDLAAFVKAFKGWYAELQPGWRKRDGELWAKDGVVAEDMGPLNTRGMCGWLSVAACLWWWGLCVFEDEDAEAKRIWQGYLEDAAWMLRVVRIRGER